MASSIITTTKRKRKPAGTPDPDAEVVSLSPRTLMESDRYVCEICNEGFQRDQNLQMHRRRHKVPWKLVKKPAEVTRKRVYVCPEPSCLHHDPGHALGDLVGIKKHYRRKHSSHKQWVCARCGKGYAVQSDYKAHLKTCGTRGHACDCGRVFSRVESFIEHHDSCNTNHATAPCEPQTPRFAGISQASSSPSPSSDSKFPTITTIITARHPRLTAMASASIFHLPPPPGDSQKTCNLELQLKPAESIPEAELQLSALPTDCSSSLDLLPSSSGKNIGERELRTVTKEITVAIEARKQARELVVLAEREFADAKRIRQQSQTELQKALAMRENAAKQIKMMLLQITCHACRQQKQSNSTAGFGEQ